MAKLFPKASVASDGLGAGPSGANAWNLLQSAARPALTIQDVRRVARSLPRTEEHLIHGRVKFRIRSIVYIDFSRDGKTMGFAFPKELRSALVEGEPDKFLMPRASGLRFNWVCVRLEALSAREMRTLVHEAWRMVVPRSVAAAHEREPFFGQTRPSRRIATKGENP
jgi:hypothetical protein